MNSSESFFFGQYAYTNQTKQCNISETKFQCQEQRGTANGISTTAMSFFKSIAPVGAGAL